MSLYQQLNSNQAQFTSNRDDFYTLATDPEYNQCLQSQPSSACIEANQKINSMNQSMHSISRVTNNIISNQPSLNDLEVNYNDNSHLFNYEINQEVQNLLKNTQITLPRKNKYIQVLAKVNYLWAIIFIIILIIILIFYFKKSYLKFFKLKKKDKKDKKIKR